MTYQAVIDRLRASKIKGNEQLRRDAADYIEYLERSLDWWDDFRKRGEELVSQERRERKHPGCICDFRKSDLRGFKINPECGYHAIAARFPNDHSIPWNCPTFWDGCNCRDALDKRKK